MKVCYNALRMSIPFTQERPISPMVTEVSFPSATPFFKGHFPDRPITPGVMLIDKAVASAKKIFGCGICLTCIKKVKFMNPVLPDDPVTLDLTVGHEGEITYSFSRKGMRCASGVLVFRTD